MAWPCGGGKVWNRQEPREAGRIVWGLPVRAGDHENLGRCNGTRVGRRLYEARIWMSIVGTASWFRYPLAGFL